MKAVVLIVCLLPALGCVALTAWAVVKTRRPKDRLAEVADSFGDPGSSLIAMADPVRVAAKALVCMPSLNPAEPVNLRFAATFLGWDHFSGTPLWTQHENSALPVGPPRSGKSLLLVRRHCEDAPGPCVVTSTKNEVTDLVGDRLQTGQWCGVFDAGGSYDGDLPRVRWNIVDGCEAPRVAMARAEAIVAGSSESDADGSGNSRFFKISASIVLQCLLHAAAIGGRAMDSVIAWAADFENTEPHTILSSQQFAHAAAPGWAAKLRLQTRGASEVTIDSTRKTLASVLRIFDDPAVLATVCLPAGASLNLEAFITDPGRPLLAIVSDPGAEGGSAAAVTTAFAAALLATAKRVSQQRHARWPWHGPLSPRRLSPCLRFVGDEYCNIAPAPGTDKLMSDSGGRGIELNLYVQGRDQLFDRFGREAGRAIWSAANVKIFLGGSSDVDMLDDLSRLLGTRDVEVVSLSYSRQGGRSHSSRVEEKKVLSLDQIRELEDGQALVFYTNRRAALVDLADLDPHTGLLTYRPTPEIIVPPEKIQAAFNPGSRGLAALVGRVGARRDTKAA